MPGLAGPGATGLSVSVNVSARQLQEPEFFDEVVEALARSGLEADSLVLEVTESVLVIDVARIGAIMRTVRDLGVHIALDDFGTGFSSLLYLQGLPIDRLKVDRSFVAGLGTADRDPTIVSTVVDLAHKLGLRGGGRGRGDRSRARCGRGDGLRRGAGLPAGGRPGTCRPLCRPVGRPRAELARGHRRPAEPCRTSPSAPSRSVGTRANSWS